MDDTSLTLKEPEAAPPNFPRKTAEALAPENRLAGCAWPITVTLGSSTLSCEIAGGTAPDLNSYLRIALRIDDQPAELFITPSLYRELAGSIDPEALAEDLDGKVKALLLEAGLASDLERLEAALGWRVAFEQVHVAQDRKPADHVWLEVALDNDIRGPLAFSLPPSHLARLAAHLSVEGRERPDERAPLPLAVTLSLRAGSTVLDLADLRSLRPGDILLMDHTLFGAGKIGLAGGHDSWLFDAALGDDGVTLASARRAPHSRDRELWLMDDLNDERETDENTDQTAPSAETEDHADPADPPSLDDLPIRLLFEIGRVEVSLGELGELGPGHVFDLDRDLHKSVDIRAAGKKIGKGEIVEIDGRIGVRIGRLFDHA